MLKLPTAGDFCFRRNSGRQLIGAFRHNDSKTFGAQWRTHECHEAHALKLLDEWVRYLHTSPHSTQIGENKHRSVLMTYEPYYREQVDDFAIGLVRTNRTRASRTRVDDYSFSFRNLAWGQCGEHFHVNFGFDGMKVTLESRRDQANLRIHLQQTLVAYFRSQQNFRPHR